ncbi:MAG: ImmA/IrrE family metallo-endopeptidase [Oscillospiraceae bacterium]|nr:ImmA/IrrE family metallo-endopeptidase [Oscillospiraceae bacterium]
MADQYELKQVRVYLKEATPLYSNQEITSPESAVRIMSEALAGMDREYCCVVNLDNRHRPINFNIVSIGDASSAVVPIQNVFKTAIASSASNIMLLHNHPSGVLEASREDELITEKLIYAGKLLDINVIDHVIVGGTEGKYFSFKEEADFLFEAPLKLGDEVIADKKTMKDQLKEITDRLEEGIEEVFTSDNYKNYLSTMAKFHKYSFNNTLLIALQNPDATLVAGYDAWKRKFHRHVKRGEKAIKIIAPMTFKGTQEVEKVDPVTQEIILNAQGEPETEKKEYSYQRFKVSNVFDYAQTEGEPIPTLEVPELMGDQKNYEIFMEAIRKVAPVPIRFDDIQGEAKGYYDNVKKEIVIRKGMSEIQTIKTAVHELGHSLCHDRDFLQAAGEKKDRVTMELEAESVAFCVCSALKLDQDVGEYSFPYIAGWAADRDRNVLRESMDLIRTTSGSIIDGMTEVFKEYGLMKGQDLDHDQVNDFFEIYQIDPEGPAKDRMFLGAEYLEIHGIPVSPDDYRQVYRGNLEPGTSLEDIYERFNLNRPDDFTGHSLSVGDVVVFSRGGTRQASFVDIVGFKDLPGFLPEMVPEKTAVQAFTQRTNEQRKDLMKRSTPERKEEAAVRL